MKLTLTKQIIEKYFVQKENGIIFDKKIDHSKFYFESIQNYQKFLKQKLTRKTRFRKLRQFEKSEKIWTAITFIELFENSTNLKLKLKEILIDAFGTTVPIKILKGHNGFITWDDCLRGEIKLYFEANLPSPEVFKKHLSYNLDKTNFIPYIQDIGKAKKGNETQYRNNLEGPTDVDAIIINITNGFSIYIEAKVLSDISTQVTYDIKRNQIARNIDVMLEEKGNLNLCKELQSIDKDSSLFLLLTPSAFKEDPYSRLYGYKFLDYKNNPNKIKKDLPHRSLENIDWNNLSDRVGWTTWEAIHKKDIPGIIEEFKEIIIEKEKASEVEKEEEIANY